MATAIPNRLFKAQEVCELVELQPYVLKSWEAEFPDLGLSKSADGPRVYRRADVERVLRIKHLLLVEGLTLAGARRQLAEEGVIATEPEATDEVDESEVASLMDQQLRQGMREVRQGLRWIIGMLDGRDVDDAEFRLVAMPAAGANGRGRAPSRGAAGSRGQEGKGAAKAAKQVRSSKSSARPTKSKPSRPARKTAARRKR